MAKSGGSRGRPAKRGGPIRAKAPVKGSAAGAAKPKKPKTPPRPAEAASAVPPPARFTLGAIPGATPGKWIDTWKERMPHTALELVAVSIADQRRALLDAEVDAALVRLPLDSAGLHVIGLYEEQPVVVMAKDSHLTAGDELDPADLSGEVVIVPQDAVYDLDLPGTVAPRFAPPADTAAAIATVAAGVGVVIVPMSLARLHHRKDTEYRPLSGVPVSPVALAWVADRTGPAVEAFIGIVRGRTANSSRG